MAQANFLVNQALRDMTVEVRHPETRELQGSAVYISANGLLVTCAHVVEACGIAAVAGSPERVLLRVPATRTAGEAWHDAKVVWPPDSADDDLVLLEKTPGPVTVPPERIAAWGTAELSDANAFHSYGFRIRGEYTSLFADGTIVGHLPKPPNLLAEPLQLKSNGLDSGMSGAAVFDVERNLVVGFVRRVYDPAGTSSKDADLAWAIDAGVLAHSPVRGSLTEDQLERHPVSSPEVEQSLVPIVEVTKRRDFVAHAPTTLTRLVGRSAEREILDRAWGEASSQRVVVVTGLAGEGKTSLVREWIRRFEQGAAEPGAAEPGAAEPGAADQGADGVFWWTMNADGQDVDDMLRALITHLTGGGTDPDIVPVTSARANLAASLLSRGRHIVVLDGVDVAQAQTHDLRGSFVSRGLADFVIGAANGENDSLCVLTSRLPVVAVENHRSAVSIQLGRLADADGRQLLRQNGVTGSDGDLDYLVRDWDGNALALAAVATVLRRDHGGHAVRLDEFAPAVDGAGDLIRLRALGNLTEADRSDAELAVLNVLALARSALAPSLVVAVAAAAFAVPAAAVEPALAGLISEGACRADRDGGVLMHPVLRNLYIARARLLSTDVLTTIHRALAQHFFEQIAPAEQP